MALQHENSSSKVPFVLSKYSRKNVCIQKCLDETMLLFPKKHFYIVRIVIRILNVIRKIIKTYKHNALHHFIIPHNFNCNFKVSFNSISCTYNIAEDTLSSKPIYIIPFVKSFTDNSFYNKQNCKSTLGVIKM